MCLLFSGNAISSSNGFDNDAASFRYEKRKKKELGAQSVGTTKGVKTDDDFELLN